jgi:hypothetical protein
MDIYLQIFRSTINFTGTCLIFESSWFVGLVLSGILLVICRPVFPASLVQVAAQTTDAYNKHVNERMDLYLQFFRSTISLR